MNDLTPDKPAPAPLISARGLSKSFGANRVLKEVSLDIRAGEILVLLGPNGAGKSTLLNIIGGTLEPSVGDLSLNGHPVNFAGYSGGAARAQGIQRVVQELSTFANLTVAENLALTSTDQPLDRKTLNTAAQTRMQAFPRNRIPVTAEVGTLSVAERQMVEIARAMTEPGTRLVILDEPTSALSAEEADQLADLVNTKAAEGVAIIYVTHKLEEALRLAHRVVVLRDGRLHWDGDGRTLTHDQVLTLLGATPDALRAPNPAPQDQGGQALLAIDGLETDRLHKIRLRIDAGEVVGIAGLEGAGQRELLQTIFDARGRRSGGVQSLSDIAYVSGDRKREGLLPLWSVQDNVAISAASRFTRAGFVGFAALKTAVHGWLDALGLAARATSDITALSGGNQQRALLGRALASEAPLLLLDDPTRGVDVSAKGAIYDILAKLKDNGRRAIPYSTEVAEFRECDRVYVMARGHIVAEFAGVEATEERIVQASILQPGTGPATRAETARAQTGGWLGWRVMPAAVLLVGMFLLAYALQPRVLSPFGLQLLLQASVPLAFAVMAQMLFILGGDIDLGLGFALGLANVIAATFLVDAPLLGQLGLAAVVAGYVLMAVIVEVLAVSSVVATLGASFVWLSLGLMIRETPGGSSPDWLAAVATVKLWPLPLSFYLLIAVALTGLWITASTGSGNINVPGSFTLSTVTAVIVGGASFAGGLVSPLGAVMAVVGISMITTNLGFLGVSSEYSTALGGIILILALSFRSLARRAA